MESKDYIKNIDGAERRYFASEVRAVVVDGGSSCCRWICSQVQFTYYCGVYYPFIEDRSWCV
jgi:hypothetical protein